MAKRSNFFTDSESWFNRGLSRLFDILLLGIVTTALCIPVITIGAAITANMDIMLRIALKKEDKIMKGYFQAFGKNFLKATLIWLVYLLIGALVGGTVYQLQENAAVLNVVFQGRGIVKAGRALTAGDRHVYSQA